MKIGVVSDIHCNIAGLRRALTLMGDIDLLISLGDNIYEYRFSNDVVALLREKDALVLRGNHEEMFYGPQGDGARIRPGNDPALMLWLAERPSRLDLTLAGKQLCLVHATPWSPASGPYLHPGHPDLERLEETGADFVLYGHTHMQLVRRIGKSLIVNPGSAGDGRDPRNDRQLSCAVLDLASGDARIIDYPDPESMLATL